MSVLKGKTAKTISFVIILSLLSLMKENDLHEMGLPSLDVLCLVMHCHVQIFFHMTMHY